MKNILFGLIAVVSGVVFSAFTSPRKRSVDPFFTYYIFEYQAPFGSYSKAEVENENANYWGYGTQVPNPYEYTTCDDIDQKACQIVVLGQMVIFDGTGYRLRGAGDNGYTVSITASQYLSTGKYYVNSSSSGVIYHSNQFQ